jgi:lysozyme
VDYDTLKEQLLRQEGEVLHAYEDHLGFLTIGVGRLIDKRRGGGITRAESRMLLENDIRRIEGELQKRLVYWHKLPDPVQRALCNMAFQMGVEGLLRFRKTLDHIKHGRYVEAADEALNSTWANQTPRRAKAVTDMIRGA